MKLELDDTWFLAEGKVGGFPCLIRGRQKLAQYAALKSHPYLVRISWTYNSNNKTGMPSQVQYEAMEKFENVVVKNLENDWLCIFFCVYTCNGVRKWMCYCSDTVKMGERMEHVIGQQQYSIELSVENDPDWLEYHKVLEKTGVKRGASGGITLLGE